MQKAVILFTTVLLIALCAGCSFPGVYKFDVQQGNIVDQESLSQLKVGMNRKQVHFVLGSPVIESTFSPEYESYLYTIQIAGEDVHRQNIVLHYDNDVLRKIDKREILSAQMANPAEARKTRPDYVEGI
jgi:outer membrane protein assembly factor BamE